MAEVKTAKSGFIQSTAYSLINSLKSQCQASTTLTAVDTGTFIGVGNAILQTGVENVLNQIGILMGERIYEARSYKGRFHLIKAQNTGVFTHRLSKGKFYPADTVASGDWNTNENSRNLYEGYDNGANGSGTDSSVGSMWVQTYPESVCLNYYSSDSWQKPKTIPINQLKQAFRSEAEFMNFMNSWATEWANDVEQEQEAWNKTVLLNRIAGQYYLGTQTTPVNPECCVNLTKEFNDYYGTSYTTEDLRTTYFRDFLGFFITQFKLKSDRMAVRSKLYHWNVQSPKGKDLLWHTPKANQKTILYSPLFASATAQVLPEIFNEQYLALPNAEFVEYWQAFDDLNESTSNRPKISVSKFSIPDMDSTSATYKQEVTIVPDGGSITIPYLVGVLFDEDAVLSDFQYEDAYSTPIEARKRYYNIWHTWLKGGINDYTSNFVLFYMAD